MPSTLIHMFSACPSPTFYVFFFTFVMEMKKVKKNVIAVCEYSNITIICHLLLKVKQEVNALEMLLINPKILKKKKRCQSLSVPLHFF